MSPTRGHRAGPDLHGHLGPDTDLPRTRIPAQATGTAAIGYTVGDACVQVTLHPRRWSSVLFCPRELALLRQEGLQTMSGVGTPFPAPRAPILVGVRHAWCPAGIGRASRTAGLAASRGHCLRPRGSIRRALGSNITSKVAPARAAGGTPGWLGMAALAGGGGLLCTGTWACPSEGYPMGSGSPEAAAGGPARPPELTAPPTPGLVQPWGPGTIL